MNFSRSWVWWVGLLYKFISFYIHWDDDGKICRKPGVFLFKLGGFVMFHGNFFRPIQWSDANHASTKIGKGWMADSAPMILSNVVNPKCINHPRLWGLWLGIPVDPLKWDDAYHDPLLWLVDGSPGWQLRFRHVAGWGSGEDKLGWWLGHLNSKPLFGW